MLFENNRMLWVQLDAIRVNILIELMFDTRMVFGEGFGVVWISWLGIILLKSVSVELCRFAYLLGEPTRWANELIGRFMFAYSLGEPTRWANELICRIMQNIDLQNYADSHTHWASATR